MARADINTFRIDANYAAVQGSYCAGMCSLNAFTAVYLFFKGFSNTQTGITVSILSVAAIIVQMFVSSFADSHSNIQLKKIVLILYMITITGCALMWLLPLPVAFLVITYSIAGAAQRSIMGLINALMMQIANLGLHVNYGWPRGVCSIFFAITAFVLGIIVEQFTPDIIMPISIGLLLFGIIAVIFMPNPEQLARKYPELAANPEDTANQKPILNLKVEQHPPSYIEMIRSNPTLMLFLTASTLLSLGQATAGVFMINIIEAVGGSVQNLGTAILIQAGIEFPMLFASGWVLKKFKVSNLLVFSFFCYAIKQFGFVIAPSVGAIYWVMAISLFCMGIYAFTSVLFVHRIVPPSEMVRAQSLVVVTQTLGQIIGSLISGAFIDVFGLPPLLIMGGVVLLAAAGLMIVTKRSMVSRAVPELL